MNEKNDLNVCGENNEVKSVTSGDDLMVTLKNNMRYSYNLNTINQMAY